MAVKQPQDRKPKKGTVMVQGIEISITDDRFNDWDVVEGVAIAQDDEADPGQKLVATVRVMRRLLADDYERVKAELRAANDGALTAEHMGSFLTDVFGALNPNS